MKTVAYRRFKTFSRIVTAVLVFCILTNTVFASKIVTKSVTKSVDSFDEKIGYEDENGYSGVLSKNGSSIPRVVSGEFIPGQEKTITEYKIDFGTNTPASTYMYNDGEYSGQINRIRIERDTRIVDNGYDVEKDFRKTMVNVVTDYYLNNPWEVLDKEETNPCPSSLRIDEDGYTGTLPRTATNVLEEWHQINSYPSGQPGRSILVYETTFEAVYEGTLTKHIPNYEEIEVYTGVYSGKVYSADKDTRVWEYTQNYRGRAYTQEDKEKNYGESANCSFDGEPVNIVTGSFYATDMDLVIPQTGLQLEIKRSYNSVDTRTGIIGKGWRLNYDSTLEEDFATGNAKVTYPDGHAVVFRPVAGANEYITPEPFFDTLVKNEDNSFTLKLKEKLTYSFEPGGKLTAITDSNGNSVSLQYDSSGYLKRVTGQDGTSLSFVFENGRVKTITDPINRVISYSYDAQGNLVRVKGISEGTTTFTYNSYGLTSIIDQNGNKFVENRYDQFGRVILQYDKDGNATEFHYDDANQENTCTFVSTGTSTKYKYDEKLYVIKETYADGTYEEYTYDQWGNKDSIRVANGNTTSYTFDERGNMLTVTSPAPFNYVTAFEYDADDNLIYLTTPGGSRTTFEYDAGGNLLESTIKLDNDGTEASTRYTYDSRGRLLTVTDAEGNTTAIEYGSSGLPHKITDPEQNKVVYGYDAVNRRISVTTDDGTTTTEYNGRDNIVRITDPEGNITRMKYDQIGNLIKLIKPEEYSEADDDGDGYTFYYDAMDRLIKQVDPLGNVSAARYDQEGRKIKEVNPNYYSSSAGDGAGFAFEYDARGRLISVVNPSGQKAGIKYDAAGNRIKEINANNYNEAINDGPGIQYTYDQMNRRIEVRDTEGNVINRYVYDVDGRIIKEIDAGGYLSGTNDAARYGTLYKYNLAGWLLEKRVPLKDEGGTICYGVSQYSYYKNGWLKEEKRSTEYAELTGEPLQWNTISYTYYGNGNVRAISDSTGAYMKYEYDALGRTISEEKTINDNTYSITRYRYNSAGRLDSTWNEINASDLAEGGGGTVKAETWLEYDKNGNVTKVTGPNGYETAFDYDSAGRMTASHQEVSVDEVRTRHSVATITLPKERFYNGQEFECLIEVQPDTDVRDLKMEMEYDARIYEFTGYTPRIPGVLIDAGVTGTVHIKAEGLSITASTALVSVKFKVKSGLTGNGNIILNQNAFYTDSQGLTNRFSEVINKSPSITGPDLNGDGRIETDDFTLLAKQSGIRAGDTGYDSKYDTNLDGVIDSKDFDYVKDYLFDGQSEELSPLHFIERYTNSEYSVSSQTEIRTTTYRYDKAGNLIRETDCNGNGIDYEYDECNRLISATDREGNKTRFFYDEVGNRVKIVLPENYDSSDDDGPGTEYIYDGMNRLVQIRDAERNVIQSNIYDVAGLLVKSIDAEGYLSASGDDSRYGTEFAYDVGKRVKTITTPGSKQKGMTSESYAYDALGNVTALTDGEGNTTIYERDLWGRITKVKDAENVDTLYTYDYAGNLTSVTDGNGSTTHYSYNSLNKLASITDPLGETVTYKYDKEGRLVEEKDRNGRTVQYSYNSDNNLAHRSAAGDQERYFYSQDGTLSTAISVSSIDQFEYTANGYVRKKTRNGETELEYEYDRNGSVTRVTDRSGLSTGYAYDAIGRLRTVLDGNDGLVTYEYNADNTIAEICYNNGISMVFGYDRDKNVTSLVHEGPQGTAINSYGYAYDNNGNQLTKNENGQTTFYTYDRLNRLAKADYTVAGTEEFTYDNAGNRLTRRLGSESTSYAYDAANRLTRSTVNGTATSYDYDKNGNLLTESTGSQVKNYAYDGFNRLIEAVMPDGSQMRNEYDAFGLRFATVENGSRFEFTFDRGNIISEYTSGGDLVSGSIRGIGLAARKAADGTLSYYLNNAHGDVVNLVNNAGEVLNSYKYDAFGVTTESVETVLNRFGYAGEQYDSITGQYYLRARHYNPVIGRFITEDTYLGIIGEPLSHNLYTYVSNNPVNLFDPSGHRQTEDAYNSLKCPNGKEEETGLSGILSGSNLKNFGIGILAALLNNGLDSTNVIQTALISIFGSEAAARNYIQLEKLKKGGISYLEGLVTNETAYYAGRVLTDVGLLVVGTIGTIKSAGLMAAGLEAIGAAALAETVTLGGSTLVSLAAATAGAVGVAAGAAGLSANLALAVSSFDNGIDDAKKLYEIVSGGAGKGLDRGNQKAQDIIAKEKKGAINQEFPKEWRDSTLDEIEKAAKQGNKSAQKAKKLLNDKRFDKGDNRK